MRAITKTSFVGAGYVAAGVVAWIATSVYIASTAGPDRQTHGAMFAFGDSVLFVGVFALAAVPATAAGLFFLRPYAGLWRALGAIAVAVAATSVLMLVGYVSRLDSGWLALTPLWLMATPIFAGGSLLTALVSPRSGSRLVLLAAAIVNAAVFVTIVLVWTKRISV